MNELNLEPGKYTWDWILFLGGWDEWNKKHKKNYLVFIMQKFWSVVHFYFYLLLSSPRKYPETMYVPVSCITLTHYWSENLWGRRAFSRHFTCSVDHQCTIIRRKRLTWYNTEFFLDVQGRRNSIISGEASKKMPGKNIFSHLSSKITLFSLWNLVRQVPHLFRRPWCFDL